MIRKKTQKRKEKKRTINNESLHKIKGFITSKSKHIVFSLVSIFLALAITFLILRYKEVVNIKNINLSRLSANESFNTLSEGDVVNAGETNILYFTCHINEGFLLIDSLSISRLDSWVINVPVEAYLSDGEGGFIEIRKTYAAGERIIADTTGIDYLFTRLEAQFGVKFDGYIAVNTGDLDTPGDIRSLEEYRDEINNKQIWLSPDRVRSLLTATSTNIDLSVITKLSNKKEDSEIHVEYLDIGNAEKISFQGNMLSVFSQSYIDSVFEQFPKQQDILLEQARIEVYNSVRKQGLASRISRLLINSGLSVTRVEDAPIYEEETKIYIKEEGKYEKSLSIIKHDLCIDAEVVYGSPSFVTTGDIVILLGNDIETSY